MHNTDMERDGRATARGSAEGTYARDHGWGYLDHRTCRLRAHGAAQLGVAIDPDGAWATHPTIVAYYNAFRAAYRCAAHRGDHVHDS